MSDRAQLLQDASRPDGWSANTDPNQNCTVYRQDYGKEGIGSCLDHHYGTGYSANLRPTVYYSSNLNQHDSPKLGFQCQAQRHYQQLAVSNRAKALPNIRAESSESSYLQLLTQARPRAVSCQSEYKDSYVPRRPSDSVYHNHIVGPKEESGFTEGSSLQPYTFLPLSIPRRSEMFPKLATHTSRESAFTRGSRNPLASPAVLLMRPCHGRQKSSEFALKAVGPKEDSGFIHNIPRIKTLAHTPVDPLHYLTHYMSKFCYPTAF